MSGMDGIELARRARADKRLADLRIILLSTINSRQQDTARETELHISHRLAKPIAPSELQRAIYAALGALPEAASASPERSQNEALHILLAEDTPANQPS
jgi:CheY-like chemotaxis protein